MDTKVDNAITGGDLAAPFSYDYINSPFNSYGGSKTSIVNNSPTNFSVITTTSPATEGERTVTRSWTAKTKIPKNAKFIYSFSSVLTSPRLIYTIGSQSYTLSPGSGTIDLANYKDMEFSMYFTGVSHSYDPQASIFSVLVLTNSESN